MGQLTSKRTLFFFLIATLFLNAQIKFHPLMTTHSQLCFQCDLKTNTEFRFMNHENHYANKYTLKYYDTQRFSLQFTGNTFMDHQENLAPKMNFANGLLRFSLEMIALGAMGKWGYELTDNSSQYLYMLGVPLVAAISWGTFTVANDPSRGKDGAVNVSGLTRLLIETAVFGFATWAIYDLNEKGYALTFGSAVLIHYAISIDRVKWLLKQ